MKNKPHVNIPQIDNSKPLVKRILIEIIEDENILLKKEAYYIGKETME